jgi:hypothetical protein
MGPLENILADVEEKIAVEECERFLLKGNGLAVGVGIFVAKAHAAATPTSSTTTTAAAAAQRRQASG